MESKINLSHKKHRGKKKNISEIKELLTLLLLLREGPIGRYQLKKMLNLANQEGVVRRILSDLQSQNYSSSSRRGSSLTEKGNVWLKKRLKSYDISAIQTFYSSLLPSSPTSLGLHLLNKADKIESAMKIRDLAVKGGATGATIILFKEGKLTVPSVHPEFLTEHPDLSQRIRESFNLKDNDVVVIISAEDEWRGLEALITIATHLSC